MKPLPLERILEGAKENIEYLERELENTPVEMQIVAASIRGSLNMATAVRDVAEKLLEEEREAFKKAEQWDSLDKEIGAYYENEQEDDGESEDNFQLGNIGETAALAFGYL